MFHYKMCNALYIGRRFAHIKRSFAFVSHKLIKTVSCRKDIIKLKWIYPYYFLSRWAIFILYEEYFNEDTWSRCSSLLLRRDWRRCESKQVVMGPQLWRVLVLDACNIHNARAPDHESCLQWYSPVLHGTEWGRGYIYIYIWLQCFQFDHVLLNPKHNKGRDCDQETRKQRRVKTRISKHELKVCYVRCMNRAEQILCKVSALGVCLCSVVGIESRSVLSVIGWTWACELGIGVRGSHVCILGSGVRLVHSSAFNKLNVKCVNVFFYRLELWD